MFHSLKSSIFLGVGVILFAAATFGQISTTALSGTVYDSSGGV
jgi:hypothetical protein